ncbi:hypothetical protein B0A50_01469 [Salinomyces thailandicus]|uniref:Uncharacterized protein n=1 Tax=Salinomyces thailandicus TaxID=706561 RepID=A0A4U0UAE9_9PEZI|nr:hypothetical protein B0A50_01469 [Salinomyces thailandica]
MESSSPPLTPIRNFVSPIETSPATSYREQLRRRTSSFSSGHSRSPVTRRKRFSNASTYSNDIPVPGAEDGYGGGMGGTGGGNLADELDQLDDDEFTEGDTTMDDVSHEGGQQLSQQQREEEVHGKEPRDSGIDVTYRSRTNSPQVRNFSKPFAKSQKPPDEQEEDGETQEDRLSPDLEDAISSIARMTAYTSTTEDPLIPRTVALLQDLGDQSQLEAGAQRLTTSTNSMTGHLKAQIKTLQHLSASLLSPFMAFSAPLDPAMAEETAPLVEALLKDLPVPDTAALHGLRRLDRETADVLQTLGQLTDTIQMGKQITSSAARHLRTTQTMVAELRQERERAELARYQLARANTAEQLMERRCASECKDVMSGFEEVCEALRLSLVHDTSGGGGGDGDDGGGGGGGGRRRSKGGSDEREAGKMVTSVA